MPELITKYPEIALEVLKSANIPCSENIKPKILIDCPQHNFCSLPQGELCVYSVKDTLHTAQFAAADFLLIPKMWVPLSLLLLMLFLAGFYTGTKYHGK